MLKKYIYEMTPATETGFPVMSCTDSETGLIVRTALASPDRSYPSSVAYVGAKFSRSRQGMVTLMGEIESAYKEGKLTPEGRLASIVQGLKHQSPGGMAHVVLAMENIPLLTAATLFRTTELHDGQEASTRFIDFESGNTLPELATLLPEGVLLSAELKDQYRGLQQEALRNYLGWLPSVREAYRQHFQIDENDKKQADVLTARSYDTVRGFLLSGLKTSEVYVTNATTTQQWLSRFNVGRLPGEKQLAETTMALLSPAEKIEGYVPEIKPLLNHTEADFRTKDEQKELNEYFLRQPGFKELLDLKRRFSGLVDNSCDLIAAEVSPADRIIAQELLCVHPALRFEQAVEFARVLSDEQKAEIGKIIFSRRDRFSIPAVAASGGSVGLKMEIDLGIERDLGRHRAWKRISPIHETHVGLEEIPETGFTQAAYLQIPEFEKIQKGMERSMNDYYEKRDGFLGELERVVGREAAEKVGMYLLPLAHQVDMIMNGDPRHMVHFQDIRIREGAHIDARLVVASANHQLADSDPLYRSLKYVDDRVKVDDREQFISRQ